jgi:tRNA(fMet)-specific endonuclease VapC
MMYSLDTNVCIGIINGRAAKARAKLLTKPASDIVVCSIVRAELWYGSAKSQTPERTREKQLLFLNPFATFAFDDAAALSYASIRASLEKRGQPIGSLDMLIAAIAKAHDLTLVTRNTKEFNRIAGLRLEDWES